jgi:hypothetical protein
MKNFFDRIVEKTKTLILGVITFLIFENRAVYEIMWKYMAEPDTPQTTT